MKALYWFRNDLRINDNEALHELCNKADLWLPFYCLDEKELQNTTLGFPKTGKYRLQFLKESLQDLATQLNDQHVDLLVTKGNTVEILKQLLTDYKIEALYYHAEVTHEEVVIENAIKQFCTENNIKVFEYWGNTLYHKDDLVIPVEKLPDVFTQFRRKHEKYGIIRKLFPKPQKFPKAIPATSNYKIELNEILEQAELDKRAALQFIGGETQALKRLQYYLFESKKIEQYKFTRNELLGADYSSKFSAWLALGCISPRTIYFAIKNYETHIKSNVSTYWLVFELIWRDYFRFVALKYGNRIFKECGIKEDKNIKANSTSIEEQKKIFAAWCNGKTGIPFIDANMIELQQTGFMSNRGRQNVASFLVKDLQVDWRWGAAWFESLLIDYDVCSNYGNWLYVAGVGNDPRENRYFNILFQIEKYDANGAYVKHWLPELQLLPKEFIHRPYLLSAEEKQFYKIEHYPEPILDIQYWKSNSTK
jgi:deoxyribodipyrimidine photo-lyase